MGLMGQYLIDTNVISDYILGQLPDRAMNFVSGVIDMTANISIMTAIETLSWRSSEEYEATIQKFVDKFNILDLSQQIVDCCIQIRRSKKIKTPDAIIAATAIVHDLTLITSDSHFSNIPELLLINPRGM
ncbi:MAG: type II toxin-antitoxin system VapC family toxin [Prevotellaceae bacterium]|jgi:predicted nucleic acid-binding protein|nr:type II toxin-antitoxin system VapC family toxin [Prevotellaceae bacterium]